MWILIISGCRFRRVMYNECRVSQRWVSAGLFLIWPTGLSVFSQHVQVDLIVRK